MRVFFTSEALAAAEYETGREILRVAFHDQTAYEYTGVPAQLYEALVNASSKGVYFNRTIRGRFPHKEITTRSRGGTLS